MRIWSYSISDVATDVFTMAGANPDQVNRVMEQRLARGTEILLRPNHHHTARLPLRLRQDGQLVEATGREGRLVRMVHDGRDVETRESDLRPLRDGVRLDVLRQTDALAQSAARQVAAPADPRDVNAVKHDGIWRLWQRVS